MRGVHAINMAGALEKVNVLAGYWRGIGGRDRLHAAQHHRHWQCRSEVTKPLTFRVDEQQFFYPAH